MSRFKGHWHNAQSDDPVWDFVEQHELPVEYHEGPIEPEICGHWHKTQAVQKCIEYVDEYEFSGTCTQSRNLAPGEMFIYVSPEESSSFGGFFYGCLDSSGTIFRFDPTTMTIEKSTTFADADINAIYQIIFSNDKIYAAITQDGTTGKWIQKIDLPDPYDAPANFTLDGDPLYSGDVVNGTDGKIYGCRGTIDMFYGNNFRPITGANWADFFEELPITYGYTVYDWVDLEARDPDVTVGSRHVDFKLLSDGYLISTGPESAFLVFTSAIHKIGFTGAYSFTFEQGLSIGPRQMSKEPNGSRIVAFRNDSAFSGLTAFIGDYSTGTFVEYEVSGLLDDNGDPRDNAIYHVQTVWHSNGKIYNLHGLYSDFPGRIVAISPSDGSVLHQYWIGLAINVSNCCFSILGDYVYVWQDADTADDSYSAIIKLTLTLEFVCHYDCRGLLRTNAYREIGGDIASDGSRYLYNFTRENSQTRLGVVRYDTDPPLSGDYPHEPVWPFTKIVDKF